MKRVTHIIPVGHTKETLIEGMRQFPFHKVVLVLGKKSGQGEAKALEVAKEIEKEIKSLALVEYLHVEVDDVFQAAIDIARVIKSEQLEGKEVRVNASGSLRTVGISCYLATAVTKTTLYVALPMYEKGMIRGVRNVIDVPSYPIKEVGGEELLILKHLKENGPAGSVDELISRINRRGKTAKEHMKERARISYHLKKLKKDGFIETKKSGKNLRIMLTQLGELYTTGRA